MYVLGQGLEDSQAEITGNYVDPTAENFTYPRPLGETLYLKYLELSS
jgi:hypothetical protein